MSITNTGYKAYAKLIKVTDDGTNRPLDDNNHLVSETNLAQSIKDNLISDPNYISPVQDLVLCPVNVPPSNSYNAIQLSYYPTIDVCDKTQSSYQISNASFNANSLLYNTDDSVAANGWYSNGVDKAFWDGVILSSFQDCVITPEPTYTPFGTYRKDDPCGVDYKVFKMNSTGYFYYKSGEEYLLASPYSWFEYDRLEAGFYVWIMQVFVDDYMYSGGEQNSNCPPVFPQVLALRSGQGYATTEEINICAESLVADCKIAAQNSNLITSGDVMYEADGITVFDGGNMYYNVALSLWTGVQGTRVCFVDNNGVIGVSIICTSGGEAGER